MTEEESENKSDSNVIMRLPNIVRATVINRPSKVVRSPYMADIIVEGWRHENTTSPISMDYSLDLVDIGLCIVGVNPMLCNKVEIET